MPRHHNTTRTGHGFTQATVDAVWRKGRTVPGRNPAQYRKDSCNARMDRLAYGSTKSASGWEIDHIKPVAKGGSDDLSNLQPLQWQNNRKKGDDWPNWNCAVSAA